MKLINDIDSRLAFDLATGIADVEDVLERYGLTKEDLRVRLQNPTFKKIYHEAKSLWNSDLSIKERVRLKAMALVEDSLLELYTIFHTTDVAAPARIEAFRRLAQVATVDTPDKTNEVGNRVNVVFNFGGSDPSVFHGKVYDNQLEEAS